VTVSYGGIVPPIYDRSARNQPERIEEGRMPSQADLLARRASEFVLWRPHGATTPPHLIVGRFVAGNPPTLGGERRLPMTAVAGLDGLWRIAAADCGFADGDIIHYWFEVEDTGPQRQGSATVRCTDPAAHTVDWGLTAESGDQPAAVLRFAGGRLGVCDPGGELPDFAGDIPLDHAAPNNRLVIYELPTAWTRNQPQNQRERAVGTFRDVRALVDEAVGGANFAGLPVLAVGRSYLGELGINALELLPPADSFVKREWGYDTAHYLAPDYELGLPEGNSSSTANADIAALIVACHRHGVRFFVDMVMAFGQFEPYLVLDFDDFYIADPADHTDDPDALTSGRGDGHRDIRNGFGSTLFRYTRPLSLPAYDPITGLNLVTVPARQHMYTYLTRWMRDLRIDGIRLDSVENLANWDFVGGFKNRARDLWRERWAAQGLGDGVEERFLVVGEELSLPLALLTQQRLDGLWNDQFRALSRAALIGQSENGLSFEDTVRQAIDCRYLGFADGTNAVNYLTSHDVEGYRRERLFNFFGNAGVIDIERRVKLAFVCLLTAVGIPMILAGEEFADQHDLFDSNGNVTQAGGKQVDPVDFNRLQEDWRRRIFDFVAGLVKFRTASPALALNDTTFIHTDFNDGKRVLVWRRGGDGQPPVVVVANFSDFVSQNALTPEGEYRVPNWPATPAGSRWREVTQDRLVAPEFVGREPVFAWEAKVYTLA
jgi:pullulanase